MTWYADELLFPATPAIRDVLDEHDILRPFTYFVVEPLNHNWHDDRVRHGLPRNGLAVVRPSKQGPRPSPLWRRVEPSHRMTLAITPELIVRDHPDQDLASFPPISMLEFLKQLNAMTCCPAIAYFCLTWGGDVEFEYAWCFPERLLLRIPVGDSRGVPRYLEYSGSGAEEREGDVLQEALRLLGLEIPTPYFALHTGSFPWERYHISSDYDIGP